ncbi:hypothetical protein MES4922_30382 [Mesorhizobium ventifaucium]|uniref:Uncharacterized protein n=1 Tax=Mesorhizobium ventifaucium TaxID=666020 RepID=A0ABM9DZ12_9HYPH|nr:hypothetical protein MES4922_30382 [Mesorhizobium ventifaucium]
MPIIPHRFSWNTGFAPLSPAAAELAQKGIECACNVLPLISLRKMVGDAGIEPATPPV